MEEIEISSRLYHEDGADYITVVLPGQSLDQGHIAGPVTFILAPERLITVRHHNPRPFETYPRHAETGAAGVSSPERVFLGLVDEIVARLADILEGAGRVLEKAARGVFGGGRTRSRPLAGDAGRGRAAGRTAQPRADRGADDGTGDVVLCHPRPRRKLKELIKALQRDLQALAVHADFLSSRISLVVDATLGMINLSQNAASRTLSVVAVLFLPPTLVASIYGMNFPQIPGLAAPWGYYAALLGMVASAGASWLFFRWKKWL